MLNIPLLISSFPALRLLLFDAVHELAATLKFHRYFMGLWQNQDRTGLDQIGSDWTGPDRTGLDQIRSD